jgi:hypothetical protein
VSLYRKAQETKHVRLTVNQATSYFHFLITEHFHVDDINYLPDVNKAAKLLQGEDKKNQAVIDEHEEAHSLFKKTKV